MPEISNLEQFDKLFAEQLKKFFPDNRGLSKVRILDGKVWLVDSEYPRVRLEEDNTCSFISNTKKKTGLKIDEAVDLFANDIKSKITVHDSQPWTAEEFQKEYKAQGGYSHSPHENWYPDMSAYINRSKTESENSLTNKKAEDNRSKTVKKKTVKKKSFTNDKKSNIKTFRLLCFFLEISARIIVIAFIIFLLLLIMLTIGAGVLAVPFFILFLFLLIFGGIWCWAVKTKDKMACSSNSKDFIPAVVEEEIASKFKWKNKDKASQKTIDKAEKIIEVNVQQSTDRLEKEKAINVEKIEQAIDIAESNESERDIHPGGISRYSKEANDNKELFSFYGYKYSGWGISEMVCIDKKSGQAKYIATQYDGQIAAQTWCIESMNISYDEMYELAKKYDKKDCAKYKDITKDNWKKLLD